MPKARKVIKLNNKVLKLNVQRKFRIGSRKGPTSALQMSTKDLKKVMEDSNKKRYHNKAAAVLRMRGALV